MRLWNDRTFEEVSAVLELPYFKQNTVTFFFIKCGFLQYSGSLKLLPEEENKNHTFLGRKILDFTIVDRINRNMS